MVSFGVFPSCHRFVVSADSMRGEISVTIECDHFFCVSSLLVWRPSPVGNLREFPTIAKGCRTITPSLFKA